MRKLLILLLSLYTLSAHAEKFKLKSSSIAEKAKIPVLFTCDGKDLSPELVWTGAPNKTKTFALVVADPDAPKGIFYHWVLYNIPNTVSKLEEGTQDFPAKGTVGKNTWDLTRYKGPCPPQGATHRYIFTLYAVDNALKLENADAQSLLSELKNHTLGKAELTGTYNH